MTALTERPARVELLDDLQPIELATEPTEGGGEQRRCRMNAYTGAVFERWWGRCVIDLAGMELPEEVPLYRQHDATRYVGRGAAKKSGAKALDVDGFLFSGVKDADDVALISDQGGKWQASVGLDVDHAAVDTIGEASSVEVNGRTLEGPLEVWRKTKLVEVSFVPRGADGATSAVALEDQQQKGGRMPAPTTEVKPDPMLAERERVRQIRETFGKKDSEFALDAATRGLSLAEAKVEWAERVESKLEADKAKLAEELAAEKKKLSEAEARLAKPSVASLLGAPGVGASRAGGEAPKDPIERYEHELAAECARLKASGARIDASTRGLDLGEEANLRARANLELDKRDPSIREEYVKEFNKRGLGRRRQNG